MTRAQKYAAGIAAALGAIVFFATRTRKPTGETLRFRALKLDPHAGDIVLGPRVTPKPAAWPHDQGVFSAADIAAMPARRMALREAFPWGVGKTGASPQNPDIYSHFTGVYPFPDDFDPHSLDNWADQAYARRLLRAGGWLTDEFGRHLPYIAPVYNTSNTDQYRGSLASSLAALGVDIADVVSNVAVVYSSLKSAVKGVTDSPLWKIAQTGASFIPGVGTAVSVGMSAAYSFGHDVSLKDAALAAARDAIPGGPAAQAAFDVGVGLAEGQTLTQASITAARNQLPANARPGFDAGVQAAGG